MATTDLVLRPLSIDDYDYGFVDLLSRLTTTRSPDGTEVTRTQFHDLYVHMMKETSAYYVAVVEDTVKKQVVGTATLLVEFKFVHGCGRVGHVEDVVVQSDEYRGKNVGKMLIEHLIDMAQTWGCYKVILDCAEENVGFYEKCGLQRKEVQMVKYM